MKTNLKESLIDKIQSIIQFKNTKCLEYMNVAQLSFILKDLEYNQELSN
jgi:hypothetical protein